MKQFEDIIHHISHGLHLVKPLLIETALFAIGAYEIWEFAWRAVEK